jgi:hypothetical protein
VSAKACHAQKHYSIQLLRLSTTKKILSIRWRPDMKKILLLMLSTLVLLAMFTSCELLSPSDVGRVTITSHEVGETISGIITLAGDFSGDVEFVLVVLNDVEIDADLIMSTGKWSLDIISSDYPDGEYTITIAAWTTGELLDSKEITLTFTNGNATSNVSLEFRNFNDLGEPVIDGDWHIVGTFAGADTDWELPESRTRTVVLTAGNGIYPAGESTLIDEELFTFTLVEPGGWTRSWFPANAGNSETIVGDFLLQNFELAVPLDGGTHAVVVDAADNYVEISLDGTVQTAGGAYAYSKSVDVNIMFDGTAPTGTSGDICLTAPPQVLQGGGAYNSFVHVIYDQTATQLLTINYTEVLPDLSYDWFTSFLDPTTSSDGDWEWFSEWGNNFKAPTTGDTGVVLYQPIGYAPLFLGDGDLVIADNGPATAPPGTVKAVIILNNIPPSAEGIDFTLVGQDLYNSAGEGHSWDNDYGEFTSTVSANSVTFTVYFDPGFDFSGWPAGSFDPGDELAFAIVRNKFWNRVLDSYDNAVSNGNADNTVFIIDADIDESVNIGDQITITLDYDVAGAGPLF